MKDEVTANVDSSIREFESVEQKQRQDLRKRLKEYALRILRLYDSLPKSGAVHVITHQLARSGTSPMAHYREACRAKSNADFISKMEGSLQELEESEYWLELLAESGFVSEERLASIKKETGELKGIFVSIVRNTKAKSKSPRL